MLWIALMMIVVTSPAYAGERPRLPESESVQAVDLANYLRTNPNVVIIDVRTRAEFERGHLPRAHHMDWWLDSGFWSKLKPFERLKESKTFVLYCHDDFRARQAAEAMRELGFSKVFVVRGGAMAIPRTMLTYPRKVEPPSSGYRSQPKEDSALQSNRRALRVLKSEGVPECETPCCTGRR